MLDLAQHACSIASLNTHTHTSLTVRITQRALIRHTVHTRCFRFGAIFTHPLLYNTATCVCVNITVYATNCSPPPYKYTDTHTTARVRARTPKRIRSLSHTLAMAQHSDEATTATAAATTSAVTMASTTPPVVVARSASAQLAAAFTRNLQEMYGELLKPVITPEGEVVLAVQCGDNRGLLYLSRFCQGSKGPCIFFNSQWLTPNEFQYVSGRESAKDWKRSIRHHGKSLKLLLSKGILAVHPSSCTCPGCRISSPVVS